MGLRTSHTATKSPVAISGPRSERQTVKQTPSTTSCGKWCTRIKAIGIARSNAYEAPKPLEFGQTGAYWEQIGWRVDVGYRSP